MRVPYKIFIFQCQDWGRWVFILVRAKRKKAAQKIVVEKTEGLKLTKWVGGSFSEKEPAIQKLLETHELETLYEAQIGTNKDPEKKLVIAHA